MLHTIPPIFYYFASPSLSNHHFMKRIFALVPLLLLLHIHNATAQVIAISKPVFTYKQNFDSLASSGTSSTLPNGWYMYESGTAANSTYTADSGASSTGDTYSYGHKGSSDRALGTLASGSIESYIGAQFKNTSGYNINSITLSFTIEQWRLGATGRADSMTADVTTFATGLSSGFWIGLPLLNIHSPVTSGTTGQLDGNASANRKKFSYTLSGISVASGSSIWIRWHDKNIPGSNDGLAIDDFSLSVKAYIPHTVRSVKFPQTLGLPDTTQSGVFRGLVLGSNYQGGGLNLAFKDSTGSIMAISQAKTYGYTPAIGDSVAIYGLVKSSNYLTYISLDSIGLINTNNSIGKPKIVTNINNDTLESGLVKINKVSLATGYKWDTTGAGKNGGFMTTMTNGTTNYNVWVNKYTDLYSKPAPKFPYNLVGIVLQNGTTPTNGYYIWPRNAADIDTIPLPLYKISQVRGQNTTTGVSDSAGNGHQILLKGIVYSPDLTKPNLQFSFMDNTGAITAVSTTVKNYVPNIGDSVMVRGTMGQQQGFTVIIADSVRTLRKSAAALIKPTIVTKVTESNESGLIKFNNAHIVDATKWLPTGSGFIVKYTDGADTIDVNILSGTDLFSLLAAPVGKFNLTGLGGQVKASSPFTSGYQLWPRGVFDFEKILPFAPIPLYSIKQLKGYNVTTGVADSLNKGTGYIKGIVYSQSFSGTALEFSLIDNTGAIMVFSSKIKYYTPAIGDSLLIKGTVSQTNGQTQYTADSIISLTKGTLLKSAAVVTVLNESTESDLVQIKNVFVADPADWTPAGAGFSVKVTNGKDSFAMFVSSTTDLFKMSAAPKGRYDIIGIGGQNKATSPYLGSYFIEPRGFSDFRHVIQLYKIREVRGQNPTTGVADSVTAITPFLVKGIVESPSYDKSDLAFAMKDSTGAVFVNAQLSIGYTPKAGDSIEIRGLVHQINGMTYIVADSLSTLVAANPVLNPTLVTKLTEPMEASLVRFNNAWLVDPTQWTNAKGDFFVDMTDGKDSVKLYITDGTDLFSKPAPKGKFNVIGIVGQDKVGAPYFGSYMLIPRSISDISYVPYHLYQIGQVKGFNVVSGIADSIHTYCLLKGVVQSENLSGDGTIQWFPIQDQTGGIIISSQTAYKGYVTHVGDSLEVRGTVRQDNGLTWFDMDSLSKLSVASPISPVLVTKLDETTEANLVTLKGYKLVDSTQWDTTGKNGHFTVKAVDLSNDTLAMTIVQGTDLYLNAAKPSSHFDVTGIGSQLDASQPYLQNYYLIPRSTADFVHSTGVEPANNLGALLKIYPNPAQAMVRVEAGFAMKKIEILDIAGRALMAALPNAPFYSLDMSGLQPGMYFIKISDGQNETMKKLVKE